MNPNCLYVSVQTTASLLLYSNLKATAPTDWLDEKVRYHWKLTSNDNELSDSILDDISRDPEMQGRYTIRCDLFFASIGLLLRIIIAPDQFVGCAID